MASFFESSASELQEWLDEYDYVKPQEAYKLLRNYMLSEFTRTLDEQKLTIDTMKLDPENFAELITLVYEKKISSSAAKELLAHMVLYGGDPTEIAKDKDLFQMSDAGELEAAVKSVVEENPGPVAEYKSGKTNALQFLVGQAMKKTKGKGNPGALRDLLEETLYN